MMGAILLAWVCCGVVPGPVSGTTGDQSPSPSPARVDWGALKDLDGKPLKPQKGEPVRFFCLIFLGTECPVSNGYCPEYRSLARDYKGKGIAFVGVHPDADVDAVRARDHAREYEVPFVLHLDSKQTLARATGVTFTPEATILDPEGKVLWTGRIDDTWMPGGKKRAVVTRRDLRIALDALLEGKAPPPAAAKPFGCPLPEIHGKP